MKHRTKLGAFSVVLAAMVFSAANAKTKFGADWSEAIVSPTFALQETIRQISAADTTYYGGLSLGTETTRVNGGLTDGMLSVPLNSSRAAPSVGLVLGARRVAANGFFLGGEMFLNLSRSAQDSSFIYTPPPLVGGAGATFDQSAKLGPQVGARLLGGYEVDGVRWFVGVGAVSATSSVSVRSTNLGQIGSNRRGMVGSNIVAGMEVDLSPGVTIRGAWERSNFGEVTYGTTHNASHTVGLKSRKLSLGLFVRN
jgi:opacity protein-like surface antigen